MADQKLSSPINNQALFVCGSWTSPSSNLNRVLAFELSIYHNNFLGLLMTSHSPFDPSQYTFYTDNIQTPPKQQQHRSKDGKGGADVG